MYTQTKLKDFITTCSESKLTESKINQLTDYFMDKQLIMYNTKDKLDSRISHPMDAKEFQELIEILLDMDIMQGIKFAIASNY